MRSVVARTEFFNTEMSLSHRTSNLLFSEDSLELFSQGIHRTFLCEITADQLAKCTNHDGKSNMNLL